MVPSSSLPDTGTSTSRSPWAMRRATVEPAATGPRIWRASRNAIMAALYFHALRPQDKVAVKPHAGPVLHAIHYLLSNQTLDKLQRFRDRKSTRLNSSH